jgi:hypothetical protein
LEAIAASVIHNEYIGFCALSEVSVSMPLLWCFWEEDSLREGWKKLENKNNKSKITIDWINNFP